MDKGHLLNESVQVVRKINLAVTVEVDKIHELAETVELVIWPESLKMFQMNRTVEINKNQLNWLTEIMAKIMAGMPELNKMHQTRGISFIS